MTVEKLRDDLTIRSIDELISWLDIAGFTFVPLKYVFFQTPEGPVTIKPFSNNLPLPKLTPSSFSARNIINAYN